MNDRPATPPHATLPAAVPAAPRRALWLLAALVALLHWLVLADGPWDIGLNRSPQTRLPDTLVFNTRRIEAPPPRSSPAPAATGQAGSQRSAQLPPCMHGCAARLR